MPINDTTTNRAYQKPNVANTLADDVARLRSALDAIDTDVNTLLGKFAGAYTASGMTLATARLLGRTTASTGAAEEISIGNGLNLASGSLSAQLNNYSGAYGQSVVAVAALDIDCSLGNYFTKTINGASVFTVSSVPSGRAYAFTLELTHTSGAITWFANVEWPSGTAPTLTTGKTHLFMFVTQNGGTRWRASSLSNYTN